LLAAEKQLRAAQSNWNKPCVAAADLEILYNLGQVYVRNAEYAKAETHPEARGSSQPDSPETFLVLRRFISAQQKPVDALDLLVRAHKLAPENTDIIYYWRL